MVYALYTFISTSYEDTMYSGKFDSTQAWKLTSSFVKLIFKKIAYARVNVRDTINIDPPWSNGADILSETLHSHYFMREFMRFLIIDHPSIS